jgi:hypothetical protein
VAMHVTAEGAKRTSARARQRKYRGHRELETNARGLRNSKPLFPLLRLQHRDGLDLKRRLHAQA